MSNMLVLMITTSMVVAVIGSNYVIRRRECKQSLTKKESDESDLMRWFFRCIEDADAEACDHDKETPRRHVVEKRGRG